MFAVLPSNTIYNSNTVYTVGPKVPPHESIGKCGQPLALSPSTPCYTTHVVQVKRNVIFERLNNISAEKRWFGRH